MPEVETNHLKAGTKHVEETGHVLALRSALASNCSECDWSSEPDDGEAIEILAEDIANGDVWLGDGTTELTVTSRTRGAARLCVPWAAPRSAIPVPMKMVLIRGTLVQPDMPDYTGEWHLQPDQPIVVRRG